MSQAIYDEGLRKKITRLRALLAVPKVEKITTAEWKKRLTAAELAEASAVPGTGGDVVEMVTAPHIAVEIEDLKRDILGSGVTPAELAERTAPGCSGF